MMIGQPLTSSGWCSERGVGQKMVLYVRIWLVGSLGEREMDADDWEDEERMDQ